MISVLFNPDNWEVASTDNVLEELKRNSDRKEKEELYNYFDWRNSHNEISPLALYKFLKAKFGAPNGALMFLKNSTTDNLIHWNYTLLQDTNRIDFWGMNSGLEITVRINKDEVIEENDWAILINNIKKSFSKYGEKMNAIQGEFEKWSLFMNPYSRILHSLEDLLDELEKLDLTDVVLPLSTSTDSEMSNYYTQLERWATNINKQVTLGSTIRMLCPVLIESFINLIILVHAKDEFKNDNRLYDNFIRQNIDIRVKLLHLNCTGFENPINPDTKEFKDFQSLMNRRNDFLHGNVDPNKLLVGDVFFDDKNIPLFNEDEGLIKKMLRKYTLDVERETALSDFKTASDFIAFVLCHMERTVLIRFTHLLGNRMPGINKVSKKIGVLFSDNLAEGHGRRGHKPESPA